MEKKLNVLELYNALKEQMPPEYIEKLIDCIRKDVEEA